MGCRFESYLSSITTRTYSCGYFSMKHVVALIACILFLTPSCALGQTEFHIYEGHGLRISPWMRYNKADAFFTGLIGKWEITDPDFFLHGRWGYSFGGRHPRYSAGLTKIFPTGNNEIILDAEYFSLTTSSEPMVLSDLKNSLSSVLFRADFYNYYHTRGGTFAAGYNAGDVFRVTALGGWKRYSTLKNNTRTSLFDWGGDGSEKKFEPSPAVEEGDDRLASITVEYDPRPSKMAPVTAWTGDVSYARSVAGSDFHYDRITLGLKRYQNLWGPTRMIAGVRAGSYDGKLTFTDELNTVRPMDPFLFDLGGLGSLRGYDYREFRDGNRLVSGNVDFLFNGAFFPKTPMKTWWGVGWLFRNFDLVLFADAGSLWVNDGSLLRFSGMKSELLRADAGFGLAMKNFFRVDFAWALKSGQQTRRGEWYATFHVMYNL